MMPRQNMQQAAVDGTGSHPGQAASADEEGQTNTQTKPEQDICTRTRLDLHRHWPPAANGHHSPLSLSFRSGGGDKSTRISWQQSRLCLLDQSSSHGECCCARGVVVYVCMHARDSDGHPLPLGRGGEWWWWVGRGLMTDEEPVQVANWHGSVQSIHRTSHLMAAMADYTAYFLPHVEKKGPVSTVGSFTCPCPPLITLSVTHHHHHRREEKRRVHVRPAAHAFPWK
jgi:hypothetical protein